MNRIFTLNIIPHRFLQIPLSFMQSFFMFSVIAICFCFIGWMLIDNDILDAQIPITKGEISEFKFLSTKSVLDVKLEDVNHKSVGLESYKGNIIFLYLWHSNCSSCEEELRSLAKLQKKFSQQEFKVIPVRYGEPLKAPPSKDVAQEFRKKWGYDLPQYTDGNDILYQAYMKDRNDLPMSILIDRDGQVIGALDKSIRWTNYSAVRFIKKILQQY